MLIAYLPAAIFVGVAALIPDQITNESTPSRSTPTTSATISAAILLFVAVVGPEVLCTDRKNGMLGVYLASPLTRETYLLAKVLAVLPVLALVTIGPQLLLLIGRTLVDAGPDSVGDFLVLLVRAIVAGAVVSVLYTAISLAAASLTDRRRWRRPASSSLLLVSSARHQRARRECWHDHRIYLAQPVPAPVRARAADLRRASATSRRSRPQRCVAATSRGWRRRPPSSCGGTGS